MAETRIVAGNIPQDVALVTVDGVTITGNGTPQSPLTASGGLTSGRLVLGVVNYPVSGTNLNLDPGFASGSMFNLDVVGASVIGGMTPQETGYVAFLRNDGVDTLTINHLDPAAAATSRINTAYNADLVVNPGESVTMYYNGNQWEVIQPALSLAGV